MDSRTDEEIALSVQNGDSESFGLLVERYEEKMMRYAGKFFFDNANAKDIVQEVFIKTYTNIQSFNTERKFSPWIYRIAHNELVNTIKKKSREPILYFDPDTLFPHPFSKEEPGQSYESREVKEALNKSLNDLNPLYREPLILHYFEEMDYREIAEILQIPVGTVGVRLKRGREALREAIQKQKDVI